ncbi:uncharacterized protein [Mytilus edulis]|uniref:uncharacterized protein n=1 Tax=Mytilus edulis TaxID=6550 RepID=UPI0039EE4F3D
MCAFNRYQPFMFWTNGSSECTFQKSLCSGEGQMVVTDNLTRTDTTCRCDYRKGYSFVIQSKYITYCIPSEEDCSCYNKQCLGGYILNADYQCVVGSHNGRTTNDPTISSENKSTEIFVQTETYRCTGELGLQRITTGVNEETFVLQSGEKETDSCTGKLELQHTTAEVNEETLVLQPFVKEHQIHLEYKKRGTVQDSFIRTKAFTYIYTTLRENQVTLISGPPGCGKTSMCYQAAFKLKETDNYEIIDVSNPIQLIRALIENTKPLIVIDDIVGKYSLNENSLQTWGAQSNFICHLLSHSLNAKLIVTCRSYIFRNEKFSVLKLPHFHCDMLADEMLMTKEERRQLFNLYVSEEEIQSLQDTVVMLYSFFPLICMHYQFQLQKEVTDYFTNPYDIIETEMNGLRLSSDPCFIALGLLVISYNNIDKQSLIVHDHKQTADTAITEILYDILQEIDYALITSLKGVSSSLSFLKNIYVKETISTFTSINKSMFDMLVGTVGRHLIPCILRHSKSELIKEYFELLQFTSDRNPHTITIDSRYDKLYFRRIIEDINNGFNLDVFDSVQMKHKEYRSYFLENVLKTETPIFCKSRKDGSSPLHVTTLLGYNELSFFFVESDKSQVNSRDNTGKTPLHLACLKGNVAVAKVLIKFNAEVNQLDINKVTPFMLACSSGHTELIKFLLTKDVHINAFNSFGSTPLLEACMKNNVEACSLLLENKAKVDCFNKNGDTPLHLACQAGQTKILNLILKYSVDTCINRPNVKGYTPFYLAISNGQNEIANTIIKYGADPNYQNENGSTALHSACETNKFEIVKILLEQYQVEFNKKDNKGRTPLDVSKIHKHKDISQLLIDREQRDENKVNMPIVSTSTC